MSTFQSTHPSGVRPGVAWVGVPRRGISIHAPQWGATACRCAAAWSSAYFNPRTPVGCDARHPELTTVVTDFNPRTPVGCDGCRRHAFGAAITFQSTHPSGVRRQGVGVYHFAHTISIHAPQWGATQLECGQPVPIGISIHAPQWGATVSSIRVQRPHHISIHAPQWGATRVVAHISGHALFQSTHPSGVRPP